MSSERVWMSVSSSCWRSRDDQLIGVEYHDEIDKVVIEVGSGKVFIPVGMVAGMVRDFVIAVESALSAQVPVAADEHLMAAREQVWMTVDSICHHGIDDQRLRVEYSAAVDMVMIEVGSGRIFLPVSKAANMVGDLKAVMDASLAVYAPAAIDGQVA